MAVHVTAPSRVIAKLCHHEVFSVATKYGIDCLDVPVYHYLRAVGRKVLWSSACVCVSVRTVFVRKISRERVHGSPPNLVGGTRG